MPGEWGLAQVVHPVAVWWLSHLPGASGKQWKALDKSGEGVLSGLSRRRAFSDSPLVRENQQHVLASPTSCARAAPTSALHRCSERDVKSLPSRSVARGCGHPSSDTTGCKCFLQGSWCQLAWQVKKEAKWGHKSCRRWPPKEEVVLWGALSHVANAERALALSMKILVKPRHQLFISIS